MVCELWCAEPLRRCFGNEPVHEELFSKVSGQACASVCRSRSSPQEAQSDPESHCLAMACEAVFFSSRINDEDVSRMCCC